MKQRKIFYILMLVLAAAAALGGVWLLTDQIRDEQQISRRMEETKTRLRQLEDEREALNFNRQEWENTRKRQEEAKAQAEEKVQEEAAQAEQKNQQENGTDDIHSGEAMLKPSSESGDAALPEDITSQASNGHVVAIDPGHQGSWVDMTALEPNAPGSSQMKARCTTGTAGRFSGLNEYELTLQVSLKLQQALEEKGYRVVMTRTDHDANISNSERAMLAAEEGAEISVRIHANGDDDSSVAGALTMCQSSSNPYVGNLYEESNRLSELMIQAYCDATGFQNRGIIYTDTMTGINWSQIPVTILEMGFMSNEHDDLAMAQEEFQDVMVEGIVNGIDLYFQ